MRKNTIGLQRTAFACALVASGLALTACGGGDGGDANIGTGGSPEVALILTAGESGFLQGSISTEDHLLEKISWTLSDTNLNEDGLLLSNDQCTSVDKKDEVFVNSAAGGRTGTSTWTCNLGVITPYQVSKDTKYLLTINGVDKKGSSHSTTKAVLVKPNPNPSVNGAGAAGTDFTISAGKTAPLTCAGKADSSYQWAILNNGGLPIKLDSLNTAGSSFTAPAVKTPTVVKFLCREVEKTNRVKVSSVNVTISPNSIDTLVAEIKSSAVVSPGQTLTLESQAGWFDVAGATTTGPVLTHVWTLGDDAPAGIQLMNSTSTKAEIFVPTSVTQATFFTVQLEVTGGGQTSTKKVKVLIDPYGSMEPVVTMTINGADATGSSGGGGVGVVNPVPGNAIVELTVDPKANSTRALHYKWSIISGVNTPFLAGANTKSVSFITPTMAAGTSTDIVVRVQIGYEPITETNPGVYSIDSVVRVGPPAP